MITGSFEIQRPRPIKIFLAGFISTSFACGFLILNILGEDDHTFNGAFAELFTRLFITPIIWIVGHGVILELFGYRYLLPIWKQLLAMLTTCSFAFLFANLYFWPTAFSPTNIPMMPLFIVAISVCSAVFYGVLTVIYTRVKEQLIVMVSLVMVFGFGALAGVVSVIKTKRSDSLAKHSINFKVLLPNQIESDMMHFAAPGRNRTSIEFTLSASSSAPKNKYITISETLYDQGVADVLGTPPVCNIAEVEFYIARGETNKYYRIGKCEEAGSIKGEKLWLSSCKTKKRQFSEAYFVHEGTLILANWDCYLYTDYEAVPRLRALMGGAHIASQEEVSELVENRFH